MDRKLSTIPILLMVLSLAAFTTAQADDTADQLISAARSGKAAELKQLLQNGAKPSARDGHGWTALMAASEKGQADAVRTLLMWGAEVNVKNERGLTPLMMAAGEGHKDVVQMLLKAGADSRTKDKRGWNALKWAELSNNQDVVALFGGGESQQTTASQSSSGAEPDQKAGAGDAEPPQKQAQAQAASKAEPQAKTATVTGIDRPDNCLRIRSGPGTTYTKIGCVGMGETLVITGEVSPNNNWARITEPMTGWVYTPQIESAFLAKSQAPQSSPSSSSASSAPKRPSAADRAMAELDRPDLDDCLEACDAEYRLTFGWGVRAEWRLCRSNCRDQYREVYWNR